MPARTWQPIAWAICCGSCETLTAHTARLSDDVLADIQGFITSGYGHLSLCRIPLRPVSRCRARAGGGWRRVAPAITSAALVADRRRRQEGQATGRAEHRLHRRRPRGDRIATRGSLHLSARVPGRHRASGTDRACSEIPRKAIPSNGNWAEQASRPSMRLSSSTRCRRRALEAACRAQRTLLDEAAGGVVELPGSMQSGHRPDGDCEPFGFHDGIAQPSIAGIPDDGVPTGEFILGTRTTFRSCRRRRWCRRHSIATRVLSPLENPYHRHTTVRDLGLNGSYVVYRKLQQDVAGFWQFMKREAVRSMGTDDTDHMIWLASRCVGRWPSGAPLVLAPDADDPSVRRPRRFPVP